MEVSSQPYASAPLHGLILNKRHSGPQILFGRFGEEINLVTFFGVRCPDRAVRGLVTMLTALTRILFLQRVRFNYGSVTKWRSCFWTATVRTTAVRSFKRKIRSRRQRTDIGKYSFVNRTIQHWNQLSAKC